MARGTESESAALIALLASDPNSRLVDAGNGRYALSAPSGQRPFHVPAAVVRRCAASGLLVEAERGSFAASPDAAAWAKRRASPDRPFRMQHGEVVSKPNRSGVSTLVDLEESPVAALARRAGKGGEPWLKPHAVAAAERLRRDFEIGQLQPRVTANWSASVSMDNRAGDGGGLKDLTDMAVAARIRFDRAMQAVGPELSGVLADVCCFLKGLETVEREHRWPARSAKLVLRIALDGLARHYGLTATATGRPGSRKLRHWGAEDYRPEIT